uniref:Uncharacterized protein n=1 Tax=Anopheles farauti TaxID=69004 RepID=A0A182QF44_9DIPT
MVRTRSAVETAFQLEIEVQLAQLIVHQNGLRRQIVGIQQFLERTLVYLVPIDEIFRLAHVVEPGRVRAALGPASATDVTRAYHRAHTVARAALSLRLLVRILTGGPTAATTAHLLAVHAIKLEKLDSSISSLTSHISTAPLPLLASRPRGSFSSCLESLPLPPPPPPPPGPPTPLPTRRLRPSAPVAPQCLSSTSSRAQSVQSMLEMSGESSWGWGYMTPAAMYGTVIGLSLGSASRVAATGAGWGEPAAAPAAAAAAAAAAGM